MRDARLGQIVSLLRTHGRLSATVLAERLEVTVRTIQRDIDELSARGIPVYAEQGRRGGYALLPGFRPPAAELTDAETLALFLPGGDIPAGELGMDASRTSALRKLSALLDADRSRRAGLLHERLLVVPSGWSEPVPAPTALRAVFAAVTRNREIEIGYRPADGRLRRRRCGPIGLVLAGIRWYLVARKIGGEDDGELRTYRVDRIEDIAETAVSVARNPGDDLGNLWRQARASYSQGGAVRVVVCTRREHLSKVRFVMELVCREVRERVVASGPEVLHLEGTARGIAHAAAFLVGLVDIGEVVEPAELRAELNRVARQAALVYRT